MVVYLVDLCTWIIGYIDDPSVSITSWFSHLKTWPQHWLSLESPSRNPVTTHSTPAQMMTLPHFIYIPFLFRCALPARAPPSGIRKRISPPALYYSSCDVPNRGITVGGGITVMWPIASIWQVVKRSLLLYVSSFHSDLPWYFNYMLHCVLLIISFTMHI